MSAMAGTVSNAEGLVVDALRKELSSTVEVISSTPYVSKANSGTLIEGEFDCLVFDPEKGILVFEIKGGSIRYDSKLKKWYSEDRNGKWHEIKDPFKQAQKAARALYNSIKDADIFGPSNIPLPVGHAVFFPHITWNSENLLPPHASPEVICDASSFNNLGRAVGKVLKEFRADHHRSLKEPEARSVLEKVLRPSCCVMTTLKSRMGLDEQQILSITDEQMSILDDMEEKRQIAVPGYAGTGKTLLAMEKAKRLYHEGLEVALLCFNKPLAEHMKKDLINHSDRIHVSNFHQLCRSFCKDAAVPFEIPEDKGEQQSFWDEDAPSLLFDAISQTDRRFDAVIVDEGQDFKTLWWESIEELLRDKDESYFYIFYDSNQAIYRDEIDFPVDIAPLTMKLNCRNTRRIGELVNKIGKVKLRWSGMSVDGEKPTFISYRSDKEQVKRIEKRVEMLMSKEKLEPEDIAILSTHSPAKSCLADVEELNGIPLTQDLLLPGNKLRFTSLHKFKGLEANVVLLCDVNSDNDHCRNEHLYVAVSRAKHKLLVCHNRNWKPPR